MNDSIQLIKITSFRRTSQAAQPNDSKANEARFAALIGGLFPVVSILVRRIAFPLFLLAAGLVLVQPCAGQGGTWTETGSLVIERYSHTATLLPDGKVLVVGGADSDFYPLGTPELYDPASGTWSTTSRGNTARTGHTTTLLPNGMVLVAGGNNREGYFTFSSAQLYDPASGTWTETGSLNTARNNHTATLLPNGMVLVAAGDNLSSGDLASAELYDPASGIWTETGSLNTARLRHTATLLPNGKVLVAGGFGLASAELYDPANGTWTETDSLANGRDFHTATLLPNGKVLVAGNGVAGDGNSTELYDAASGSWTTTGSLAMARQQHTATLLPNGKVLVTGGQGDSGDLASAELYDPASGTWTETGSLNTARDSHTATLLSDGTVLVAGGYNFDPRRALASAELYTPEEAGNLSLVSAASRKTHGKAGPFDIDLPLTGTPGVECRVGNGGPFLQTIVFTFSEPVTSISGATTTTCGTVNSTTINGSTVTVELGHVTCDGSDITVTVPGVTGASGSVDASATMTLRTDDVNADGVVNKTDLQEIRMNVGRGLVNEDSFRNDITVDGKVNHGDTTLEKSKL
jgi:Galactose oxidase, central domain/Dockerin type I domain